MNLSCWVGAWLCYRSYRVGETQGNGGMARLAKKKDTQELEAIHIAKVTPTMGKGQRIDDSILGGLGVGAHFIHFGQVLETVTLEERT